MSSNEPDQNEVDFGPIMTIGWGELRVLQCHVTFKDGFLIINFDPELPKPDAQSRPVA